jgi:hypothetical protein
MTATTNAINKDGASSFENVWAEAWGTCLDMQGLWLLLGVFETNKKIEAAGKLQYCHAKWFDYIAPQAHRTAMNGFPQFSERTVLKIPHLLRLSDTGLLALTEEGRALVQFVCERHPVLAENNLAHQALNVQGLGCMPPPLWNFWKSWVPLKEAK